MDWTGLTWPWLIKLSINISWIVLSSMARLGFGFAEYQFSAALIWFEVFQLELQVEGPLEVGVFVGVEVSKVSGIYEVCRL